MSIDLLLTIVYVSAFLFILIVFKIFNWKKNPFKMIRFWITQFLGAVVVTVSIFLFVLYVLGRKPSADENLANDIQSETITSVIIIQKQDTVHVDDLKIFFDKLSSVQNVRGLVKYPVYGKIIFIRKDGSKDSIRTNGSGYGPYKGKWYLSKENVLEEYFKK